jgi:hypothetical protein
MLGIHKMLYKQQSQLIVLVKNGLEVQRLFYEVWSVWVLNPNIIRIHFANYEV